MPDLGYLHPIVVHFTIALLIVGVLLQETFPQSRMLKRALENVTRWN